MRTKHPGTTLAGLYAVHASYVRRCLGKLGVSASDLDDVTQEVFLVVHRRQDDLRSVARPDLWLREICRRVAAAHRRRAQRRREVFGGSPQNLASDSSADLEQDVAEDRLHHALGKLDDESRDLIALHSGELPLVDVAELVARDRKTVRKRLRAALRRLQILVGREPSDTRPSTPPPAPDPTRSSHQGASETKLLLTTPTLTVGLLGTVVIAVWPGAATLEALEALDRQFERTLATGLQSFAYLAVVEASTRPPTLEARKKIVQLLEAHSTTIQIYATALQGGLSWIARPIMRGLALLARPPFLMDFFSGTSAAAAWLCSHHRGAAELGPAAIANAAEKLRERALQSAGRA